jgi:hypothetical protein
MFHILPVEIKERKRGNGKMKKGYNEGQRKSRK